jgi:hypothetical protein
VELMKKARPRAAARRRASTGFAQRRRSGAAESATAALAAEDGAVALTLVSPGAPRTSRAAEAEPSQKVIAGRGRPYKEAA